ncbi:MAG: VOC family protein [Gammaproteobacteria bacterium]|nr:VOC family protein [Gammaproteobacteria bacterium]
MLLFAASRRRCAALAAVLLALSLAASAQPRLPPDGPWQEAVISVRDLDAVAAFFERVAGYETIGGGQVDSRELTYYRLPAAASARYRLLRKPGTSAGYVRLVRYENVAQQPIRIGARAWDTGGFFSLMTRGRKLGTLYDEALAMGWHAESEPVQFDFGDIRLRNVVLKGPDGINIAVYERVRPQLQNWPPFERLTQPFNAMQMVRDADEAYAFYKDVLGFEVFWRGDYLDPAAGPNNFGIPQNLVTEIPRRTAIMYPVAGETGRVEVMQFKGLDGRDVSARALPPNLGILSLRFPVSDLRARRGAIKAGGVGAYFRPARLPLPPYGNVEMFAVRSPDGALIEFFEQAVSR